MTPCRPTVSWRANLGLVSLTVLLLPNVGHAAPPTAITTCPFVITTPGEYYLAMNLTCPPGDGIRIQGSSNVYLRLDGHTLQGLSSGAGISALFSRDILIQGPGTVTGFGDGLEFFEVTSSEVIQVTSTRNVTAGFVVIGTDSTNNLFQGNVATLNGTSGVELVFSSENTIVNNLVMNNLVGIDLAFGNLNKIDANIATSNMSMGISVRGMQNEINGNTALSNLVQDMFDREPNCDDNRWRGNRFDTANQPCIQ
jgi:parallel beta-helix repeat protein